MLVRTSHGNKYMGFFCNILWIRYAKENYYIKYTFITPTTNVIEKKATTDRQIKCKSSSTHIVAPKINTSSIAPIIAEPKLEKLTGKFILFPFQQDFNEENVLFAIFFQKMKIF